MTILTGASFMSIEVTDLTPKSKRNFFDFHIVQKDVPVSLEDLGSRADYVELIKYESRQESLEDFRELASFNLGLRWSGFCGGGIDFGGKGTSFDVGVDPKVLTVRDARWHAANFAEYSQSNVFSLEGTIIIPTQDQRLAISHNIREYLQTRQERRAHELNPPRSAYSLSYENAVSYFEKVAADLENIQLKVLPLEVLSFDTDLVIRTYCPFRANRKV